MLMKKNDEFKFGDTISQNLILGDETKQVFSQVKFKIEVKDNSDTYKWLRNLIT